jgi:4-hydroxy-2-oxoglutarate aldolase
MDIRGVLPPIPTPFTDEGIDHRALADNVGRWMRTKLSGIVVLGSNGEAPLLEEGEADAAIATVREVVPAGRLLIAGTGRESTAATIAATRRAGRLGVDAALVRTPAFFKNVMTTDALVRHYTAVADASPVPVLLYNVTMYTGVNMLPDAVARLAGHPNIIGMKESGSDVAQLAEFVSRTPPEFRVLGGSATTFFAALCVGASGGILALSAVLPDLCVKLYELVQRRQYDAARALQQRLTALARLLGALHGVSGLKFALDQLGYAGGRVRAPLGPLSSDAQRQIKEQLALIVQAADTGREAERMQT